MKKLLSLLLVLILVLQSSAAVGRKTTHLLRVLNRAAGAAVQTEL